jgi:hypothetical protein
MTPPPDHDRPPATWPFWVAGTAVAFFGVLLVRVVAPGLGAARIPVIVAGFVLALVGLFVITVGTRRKYTYLARRDERGKPE